MNHCEGCRSTGKECARSKEMQDRHDKLPFPLCMRKGCKQPANHMPGDKWCDDPGAPFAPLWVTYLRQLHEARKVAA